MKLTVNLLLATVILTVAGCATQPEMVPMSATIPDELTQPNEPVIIAQPPPLETTTDLPQACFDRDAQIAQHFDVMAQNLGATRTSLALCNDDKNTLHRIHENTMVLPPGTPQ